MLSAFNAKHRQLTHRFADGDHVTHLCLKNRRDGSICLLSIISALPLSIQEVRDAITAQLGDRWQWRQLFCMAEILPGLN
jgi:hypothetical protein